MIQITLFLQCRGFSILSRLQTRPLLHHISLAPPTITNHNLKREIEEIDGRNLLLLLVVASPTPMFSLSSALMLPNVKSVSLSSTLSFYPSAAFSNLAMGKALHAHLPQQSPCGNSGVFSLFFFSSQTVIGTHTQCDDIFWVYANGIQIGHH